MSIEDPTDGADVPEPDEALAAAKWCQATHTELVNLLRSTIDLLEQVQRGEERVNVPNLREAAGATMRRSAARHALSVAALTYEAFPEYAEELLDYSESLEPAAERELPPGVSRRRRRRGDH